MTDLEITKACAEAMGIVLRHSSVGEPLMSSGKLITLSGAWPFWSPLHDDAQAMALVKKFKLWIIGSDNQEDENWNVIPRNEVGISDNFSKDLNRAICECVAKMQEAK